MKKLICTLLTLTFAVGTFSSCGKVENADSLNNTTAQTISDTSETAVQNENEKKVYSGLYKSELLKEMNGDIVYYSPQKISDDLYSIIYSGNNEAGIYLTDSNFSEFAEQEFEYPDEVLEYDVYEGVPLYNSNGSFNIMVTAEDHNGMTPPPDEYDETFDYEAYWDNTTYAYFACSYSAEGVLQHCSKLEIPEELLEPDTPYWYFSNF